MFHGSQVIAGSVTSPVKPDRRSMKRRVHVACPVKNRTYKNNRIFTLPVIIDKLLQAHKNMDLAQDRPLHLHQFLNFRKLRFIQVAPSCSAILHDLITF